MKFLVGILILVGSLFWNFEALAAGGPPAVTAKSAIVIEAQTGKILYALNADERRYPASTTKIMTLIVALERGKADDIVTASPNAAAAEGSSLWLTPGEQLKLLDLMYGMMLISGNDAAVAIAEHIAGSVDNFAGLMTAKAHEIGALNTNFTNTNGLPDPNHYTTAHDLAIITAYGYKNPLFTKIVSTKNAVIPWPEKTIPRDLYNENRMLWLCNGGNGVKTGYTSLAGRCLVTGANRNGIQLVAVVLDSERMWDDSIALLDYGFEQFTPLVLYNKGDILKTARIKNGTSDFVRLEATAKVTVPNFFDDSDGFTTVIDIPDRLEAPVSAGQKIGEVKIIYKNREINQVDLVAAESVDRKSLLGTIWGSVRTVFSYLMRNFA
mgnify:CR=1 FL=1